MMSKYTSSITPPESFANLPLTPPPTDTKTSDRVARITGHIRLQKAGRALVYGQPWTAFQLVDGELEQLLSALKVNESLWGFFEDKVRYDYFSRSGRFILRMPTYIHEAFISSVTFDIQRQLEEIAKGTDTGAEFAKHIKHIGSPKLRFLVDDADEEKMKSNKGKEQLGGGGRSSINSSSTSKYSAHEPDGTFIHADAQWPGVVIEVGFSQKEKDLRDLAEEYILGSDGNIRVVICLNIEYRNLARATVSVWRPGYNVLEDGQSELICKQTVVDEEFRSANKDTPPFNPTASLSLSLCDFASEALLEDLEDLNAITQEIIIPFSRLSKFLTHAETVAEKVKERKGKMVPLKPDCRKRWRQRTPEEELEDLDEMRFLESEERAVKRATQCDRDYTGRGP